MSNVRTLKDIQFKLVNAQIMSIEHISRILIEWELEESSQDLSKLKFFIYRGESPGELFRINQSPIPGNTRYEYIDYTPKMIRLDKRYYYQVIATEVYNGTPVQEFKSRIFTFEDELDFIGLYVVEEHLYKHRHVTGMPSLIYKEKKEGERCTCWDAVLKRPTISNCVNCKGTGFIGGYYYPIEAWIEYNPDPKVAQVTDIGVTRISKTEFQFTNYPELELGDIILELEPHRFWRISNVRNTEKNRTSLIQVGTLDEVNRSDIEQQIKVPKEARKRMLDELRTRRQTPEF